MTPMPQGPLWAASGFAGSGFLAADLAGEGFVDEVLAGEGLVGEGGAAVGAVCARAGCASASASHKAILWITFRSAVSIRFDQQNCNRESVRVNRARVPNENNGAQGVPLRAWSFQARQPAISSLLGKRPVAFFENASRPSTRTSNTPPLDRRRFICAEGRSLRIISPASRARGS
jgi:hypothetical protein